MQFLKANIEKPLIFITCGQFVSEGKWIHRERNIDSFEIIIGIKGIAYIQQDNNKFEVKQGSVLLLLPNHVHKGYAMSDKNASFYWIHFQSDNLNSILDQEDAYSEMAHLKSSSYINKLKESILIPVFCIPENIEKVDIQVRQLLHIANCTYYTQLITDYFLTSILIELTQQVINSSLQIIDSYHIGNKRFIEILEWVRINIQKNITLDEIAEKFNFNKDYITRMFKKNFGVSTIRYINEMKIMKAKELLCQTNINIKEVAFELGYQDEKYFMKLFKEYEKLTPTEFRNIYYKTHFNNK